MVGALYLAQRRAVEFERMRQAVEEHEGILAAVCRDDPERAEQVARAHVRATIEALELSSDPPRAAPAANP